MLRAALLGLAAGVFWVPHAGAVTVKSTIEISGYGYDLDRGAMDGTIQSPRGACLANRKVRMSTRNGESLLLSIDRSSNNGFWGGTGTVDSPTDFVAKLLPKPLGKDRRCGGDADVSTLTRQRTGGAPQATTFPTQVAIRGAGIGDSISVNGVVIARRACRENRTVRIIALTDGDNPLIDVDRASDNGYFGGGGPAPGADGVRAVAPAVNLAPGRRCAAGSDEAPH